MTKFILNIILRNAKNGLVEYSWAENTLQVVMLEVKDTAPHLEVSYVQKNHCRWTSSGKIVKSTLLEITLHHINVVDAEAFVETYANKLHVPKENTKLCVYSPHPVGEFSK